MDYAKESLRLHGEWKGKIEMVTRVPVKTKDDLSLAYTPGVAQPCLEIQKDPSKSYELTRRWNMAAVITDGSAVLGLGDIGPEAGLPVMEGKAVLFTGDLKHPNVDFPKIAKEKPTEFVICEAAHFPATDYAPVLSACPTKQVLVNHYAPWNIPNVMQLAETLAPLPVKFVTACKSRFKFIRKKVCSVLVSRPFPFTFC